MNNPASVEVSRDKCSERFHLRGSDFFVYDVALQLTRGGAGLLTASRETIARKISYSLQTVSLSRSRLIRAGWLEPVVGTNWVQDQRRSGKAGHFQTPRFRVVRHSEWATKHPGKCLTDDVRTVYGASGHGDSEYGETENGLTVDTVHGRTHDTVHGRTGHKSLNAVSNTASTEEEKPSAVAEFGIPKVNEVPAVRTIASMQDLYRKRWKRGFSIPASTRPALEELILDRGSETILAAFELFLADKDDEFLLNSRHPVASFVRRFEVYVVDAKSKPEPELTEPLVAHEGKLIPAWLRDDKLKDKEIMAEKQRKREEKAREEATLAEFARSTPL